MSLSIVVAYCCPFGDAHMELAWRMLNSYLANPPMADHSTVILTDPGDLPAEFELFKAMPNCSFFQSHAPGLDINRYQSYAQQCNADMVLFCGGSTYFRRPGWLIKMATSFERLGRQNLYGACGNNGAPGVSPHIRTTGFWLAPSTLNAYPMKVTHPGMRYPAEHGPNCLTTWIKAMGRKAYAIDAEGEWESGHFNDSPNGYARGNQSALLVGDRLTMSPYQNNA